MTDVHTHARGDGTVDLRWTCGGVSKDAGHCRADLSHGPLTPEKAKATQKKWGSSPPQCIGCIRLAEARSEQRFDNSETRRYVAKKTKGRAALDRINQDYRRAQGLC
jgi:hypothetical protein